MLESRAGMVVARRACVIGFAAVSLIAAGASACVVVEPHQRGRLASRVMQAVPDPTEIKLDAHVYQYREGSIGGGGVGGGGCGCN